MSHLKHLAARSANRIGSSLLPRAVTVNCEYYIALDSPDADPSRAGNNHFQILHQGL